MTYQGRRLVMELLFQGRGSGSTRLFAGALLGELSLQSIHFTCLLLQLPSQSCQLKFSLYISNHSNFSSSLAMFVRQDLHEF